MTMYNPAHPGEILKELVIDSLELTITDVAQHLDVSRKTLSKILNARGAVTPEMAVRLSCVDLKVSSLSHTHFLNFLITAISNKGSVPSSQGYDFQTPL